MYFGDFNSIKVRLKLAYSVITVYSSPYFNSIKVRLKRTLRPRKYAERRFQFHKGTIKTETLKHIQKKGFDFNSIKVRLKLVATIEFYYSFYLFQFHKGTIKTAEPAKVPAAPAHFNSIKVRLKPSPQPFDYSKT